jgi:hypothetical protein
MNASRSHAKTALVALLLLASLTVATFATPKPPMPSKPDFNRDVRPILSNSCFKCHGPDDNKRQAGLRLDTPEGAKSVLKSGSFLKRIVAQDSLQMPPKEANKPLTDAQKAILSAWVKSGAKYETHWAFVPPKPAPPAPNNGSAIDRHIAAKLALLGLKIQSESDKYTLIRRVGLDLIGLPPTITETEAFIKDKSSNAYEKLVNRLLASPHYGERWGRKWLDLARYADTNGYEKDKPRTVWAWRDWVVDAINSDMPFDQFTIKQLAGDMLPNATAADRIATGFHRNTMLNEEGGIDPLEYRYYSVVDRMATTGATWMGLTVQCAQCHTHKYDPVTQKEYYQLMAFLDNADEPEIEVPDAKIKAKREEIEREIAKKEAALPEKFPIQTAITWQASKTEIAKVSSGAMTTLAPDGAVLVSGPVPDTDTYTTNVLGDETPVSAIRLETLTDKSLGNNGPGRTPHGNFVLTEVEVFADGKPIKLTRAEVDAAQEGFSAQNAIDGNPKTGWAIQIPGVMWNVNRTATFHLEKPIIAKNWSIALRQDYGGQHTIGKFKLSLGNAENQPNTNPKEKFNAAFAAWQTEKAKNAVKWTVLRPTSAKSNLPLLTIQPDNSIFVSGDQTKRDVFDLSFQNIPKNVTAMRLEALPDELLPQHGPGRISYEGPLGDFHLSTLTIAGAKIVKATATTGNAQNAIDTNPQTAWNINGGQGKAHTAVFVFDKPLSSNSLALQMVFEMYYAANLGKFRISVATQNAPTLALAPNVEAALTTPEGQRTAAQEALLLREFVRTAPELASSRAEIESLRRTMPDYTTTLAFSERPAENPRPTFVHHRGEFLQTTARVTAGLPRVIAPKSGVQNRLQFAQWLVSSQNPLTARVIVNRQWAALFGRGIVKTTEDFGYQGEMPTHPELLDDLAWRFMHEDKWSLKKLHKRIVMSRAYRQSSVISPEAMRKDPENRLLSRAPRVRLDAEVVRDVALAESGLLSRKRGGPPVFPPQPAGVTTEGAYGPLAWNVSVGEDRYRRGLYTFAKRTAPYAMFQTFDAPSGEATCPRRDSSNTPLQALTLLNDAVFFEAAQALGKKASQRIGTDSEKTTYLFQRILTRPPTKREQTTLLSFLNAQRKRLQNGELNAKPIAGIANNGDREVAAWTTMARAVFNLDEAIVKR